MRRHSILIFVGAVVLAASLPYLAPILQEIAAVRELRGEWSIRRLDLDPAPDTSASTRWVADCDDHRIAVEDTLGTPADGLDATARERRVSAPVTITVDGVRVQTGDGVEVRPGHAPPNRYWNALAAYRLESEDGERVVCGVVHRLPFDENAVERARARGEDSPHLFGYRFRTLSVEEDGLPAEERFGYADLAERPSRALVANFASPTPLGVASQVLSVWPTAIYPLIYPVGTALLGLALIGLGAATLPSSKDPS